MSCSAIFNLSALFIISFAPARAEYETFRRIKDANILKFSDISEEYPSWYDTGDVYLCRHIDAYSTQIYYKVREDSYRTRYSRHFLIDQRSTIVTKEQILIGYEEEPEMLAVILTLNEDHFAFYRELFPFDTFPEEFPATRLSREAKDYDITTIKAKSGINQEWNFIALAGDTPCLIFPAYRVISIKNKMDDKKVNFVLRAEIKFRIPITVEFDSSADANRFFEFLIRVRDVISQHFSSNDTGGLIDSAVLN